MIGLYDLVRTNAQQEQAEQDLPIVLYLVSNLQIVLLVPYWHFF